MAVRRQSPFASLCIHLRAYTSYTVVVGLYYLLLHTQVLHMGLYGPNSSSTKRIMLSTEE
jgi:hypothetical protein